MKIKPFRRAMGTLLVAGAAVLLLPAPANAAYVCWMSDGIRYCYDDTDGQVPAVPDPVPVEEPPFVPAPVPVPVPAPVEQPPIEPAPAAAPMVPAVPAPAIPIPAAVPVPVKPVPAPVYVPARSGGYNILPEETYKTTAAEAPVEPAPEVPPTAEAGPETEPQEAVDAPVPAGSTVPASPAPSVSVTASKASEQAAAAGRFDVLPLVLMMAAALLVGGVAWLVPPVRTAVLRVAKAKR